MLAEIELHNYPVPPLPEVMQNVRVLEPRLRILLDERFDAYGKVLATYGAIGKKHNISAPRARALVEKAIWILAGKPEGSYDGIEEEL